MNKIQAIKWVLKNKEHLKLIPMLFIAIFFTYEIERITDFIEDDYYEYDEWQ